MPGKKWLFGLLLAALSMTTGCCHFCDRWCGARSGYTPAAAPCCVPCCPQTVGASPVPAATGWNQPAAVAPVACVPCR